MSINDGLTPSQRAEMKDDLDMDPLRDVGSVTQVEDYDGTNYTFQHKTISRYRIGRFEFKEHLLVIRSKKDYDDFIDILRRQPPFERLGIVELNQKALQNLEADPLRASRVMHGYTDSARVDNNFRPGTVRTAAGAELESIAQTVTTQQAPVEPVVPVTQPAPTEPDAAPVAGLSGLLKK